MLPNYLPHLSVMHFLEKLLRYDIVKELVRHVKEWAKHDKEWHVRGSHLR